MSWEAVAEGPASYRKAQMGIRGCLLTERLWLRIRERMTRGPGGATPRPSRGSLVSTQTPSQISRWPARATRGWPSQPVSGASS